MSYAVAAQTSTPVSPDAWLTPEMAPDAWWLQLVEEPEIQSELVCEAMATELERAILAAPPAEQVGMAHTVLGVAGLVHRPHHRAGIVGWGEVMQLSPQDPVPS